MRLANDEEGKNGEIAVDMIVPAEKNEPHKQRVRYVFVYLSWNAIRAQWPHKQTTRYGIGIVWSAVAVLSTAWLLFITIRLLFFVCDCRHKMPSTQQPCDVLLRVY